MDIYGRKQPSFSLGKGQNAGGKGLLCDCAGTSGVLAGRAAYFAGWAADAGW